MRTVAETSVPPASFPAHIEDTIRSIARLDVEHFESATRSQRRVEHVTGWLARPFAVAMLTLLVAVWVGANVLGPRLGIAAFDPPPFTWLANMVSLGAFYVVMLILITQRREEELAQHHAQLTLQLTILGEQKTAKVIALLEELRRDLPMIHDRVDHEARAMAEPSDPHSLLHALRETEAETAPAVPAPQPQG